MGIAGLSPFFFFFCLESDTKVETFNTSEIYVCFIFLLEFYEAFVCHIFLSGVVNLILS